MINIDKAISAVREISPEALQEDWDNSGIQILLSENQQIRKILTCLEISDSVVDEAVSLDADLIITHHPLIFSKLRHVDCQDIVESQIIKLIQNNISVYSAHTSFDSARYGTNAYLADKLKLAGIKPLIEDTDFSGCGMGRYGCYEDALDFEQFCSMLAAVCSESGLRIAGSIPKKVSCVALCTGAGSEFMDEAHTLGADVYVTGDLKYHEARHASDIGLCVIDAGHYGTEVIFAENMAEQLTDKLGSSVDIVVSKTDINPFKKFIL